MSWIRHLPSIVASALLFGSIGTPLGTIVFLAIFGIMSGRPTSMFRLFDDMFLVCSLAGLLGAAPAFATGIVAGVLRIYVRPLLTFACLMALLGAVVTAIYLFILMLVMRSGWPLSGLIILTGSIAAFSCAFLLWRNRPWTISA